MHAADLLAPPWLVSTRPRPTTRGARTTALVTVGASVASQHQPTRWPFDAGTVALAGGRGGSTGLRRRHPVAVLAVAFGLAVAYAALGYANGPAWLFLVVANVTAVVREQVAALGDKLQAGPRPAGSSGCAPISPGGTG